MTMIPPGLLPEGLSDRLPPQAEASARLARRVLDTVATHGYERVMPPLAEFEDTLTQRLKSMRAQDLVRAVDPVSQRSLALRPDMTAQVGRIAATRLATAPRPLRLSYAGPVIRLKANQLRPEREKLQVGAELIGSDSVTAVVEIVNVAIEALQAAGVSGLTIDFTLPDLIDMLAAGPLPLAAGELEAVRTELDAKDAGALVALGPQAAAYLPLIEATGPFHAAMERLEAFNASLGGAIDSRIAGLRAIAKPIGWDITLTLDPTERHGFEYQNWRTKDAVDNFMYHLMKIKEYFGEDDCLVTIALDGENCWEYYRNDGRDFLRLLYSRIAETGYIKTVTVSQYLQENPPEHHLPDLSTGSWIFGDLNKWMGHPAKNRAWELLTEARNSLTPEDLSNAQLMKQLYVLEGSDWFWWYGDKQKDFDKLFRLHLKNFYQMSGRKPSVDLDTPLDI